jgi:hypothetical protein
MAALDAARVVPSLRVGLISLLRYLPASLELVTPNHPMTYTLRLTANMTC